jgi:site-specific recombinase XerD
MLNGKVYDFHALRHQFITNLARSGVHPKTTQELARHSTIALTMNFYTHVDQKERAVAVSKHRH